MYNALPIDGYVSLLDYGAFDVRFSVSYYLYGIAHSFSSGGFSVGFSRKIIVPKNAVNILVSVDLDMFIETWYPLCVRHYPKSDEICLLAYGITIAPYCIQIPCESPGTNGGNCNNSCCCCCNCSK